MRRFSQRNIGCWTVYRQPAIRPINVTATAQRADGIRANCVAPGPVYTPMVYAHGMTEQARETRRQASVLKREGTGWDIGSAVRFLLSDQARYITGQVLVVRRWGYACRSEPRLAVGWTEETRSRGTTVKAHQLARPSRAC